MDLTRFMKLWQQFKASVSEDGEDTEEEIKSAFKDYDVNGDGYITKDEMMKVRVPYLGLFFSVGLTSVIAGHLQLGLRGRQG